MTPQTPGIHVCSLSSSFVVSRARGSQPDPSELGGSQISVRGLWQPLETTTTPLIPHKAVYKPFYDSTEKCTSETIQDIGDPRPTYSDHGLSAIATVLRPRALLWQGQSRSVPQGASSTETEPWKPRAQPKRPSFTRNSIYQEASTVDLDATTPSPRGYSHSAQGIQLARRIYYGVYRSRGEVQGRIRCDPIGGNFGTAKNSSAMFCLWFHRCADVCSSFEGRQQPTALMTAFTTPAAMRVARTVRFGKTNTRQGELASTSTMVKAPALHGHRQLVQAYVSVLGLDDSGFKFCNLKHVHDQSDLKLFEERHSTKYRKYLGAMWSLEVNLKTGDLGLCPETRGCRTSGTRHSCKVYASHIRTNCEDRSLSRR